MSDEMDTRLRAYAERWRAAQLPPESRATPGLARGRSGVALVAAVVAIVAGVAAIVTADGDGGGQDVRTVHVPTVVPWVDEPAPPPAPTTTPPTAPEPTSAPCRAEDLEASLGRTGSTMGHTFREVRLRNVGTGPCWLDGYPTVNAVSDIGYLADQTMGTRFPDPGAGEVAPGGEGLVIFEDCSTSADWPRAAAVYRDVSLTLPGGGFLPVPTLELACAIVSRLGVADAPPRLPVTEPPPAPGSLASLRAELAALPERAAPGTTVRFEVVLANPTAVPVALDPCPGYSIDLEPGGAAVSATLNCRPAGAIPPGKSVRFEMRYDLEDDAAATGGLAKLSWSMSAWGGPSTGAAVMIAEAAEARAAAALVGFARSPSPATFAAVPLAAGRVHLALGSRTLVSVDPEILVDVGGWDLPSAAYAERDGSFNAIRVLAQAEGDVEIAAGPHRGCPGPAVPPPQEAAGLTQVSIQPADAPDCIRWFSIDLFVDRDGRIVVVQLDLGSP